MNKVQNFKLIRDICRGLTNWNLLINKIAIFILGFLFLSNSFSAQVKDSSIFNNQENKEKLNLIKKYFKVYKPICPFRTDTLIVKDSNRRFLSLDSISFNKFIKSYIKKYEKDFELINFYVDLQNIDIKVTEKAYKMHPEYIDMLYENFRFLGIFLQDEPFLLCFESDGTTEHMFLLQIDSNFNIISHFKIYSYCITNIYMLRCEVDCNKNIPTYPF